ncbi:MAG TPA: acyl-CoA thioesterase [Candidatus Angelobacter sp.]|jgi:acyl-CoA thioester hydrolase|nr:acyl-CoA thioesterase [Candidatus Angelobacter sp.]
MASSKNLPENWSASVEIDVPFHDVDMMEIAWHGHYVRYFEIARCKLFDQLDYNYRQMRDSGYAWPVIDLHVRYVQPLHFQQKVTVTAWIAEWENRLRVQYLITDSEGKRLTKGHTDQVAINMKTNELMLATPAILLEKLGITA